MSDSEDGQLRSPGDEHMLSADEEAEYDANSLDIKPPQASVSHVRDHSSTRRKDKSNKDKKHSKERKHKDRHSGGSGRERERDMRGLGGAGGSGSGNISGGDRRSDQRREERVDLERYHQRGGGYEREDNRDLLLNNERRYQKHYERGMDGGGGARGNHNYHHHHQMQQQQHYQQHQGQMHHVQRQRQDYYERSNQGYHHGMSGGSEYHQQRHQNYGHNKHGSHGGHMDYVHHNEPDTFDVPQQQQRERHKYSYDQQKDAESLEQDLRSRLLSKRHKYVKDGNELEEQYEVRAAKEHDRGAERSYEERECDRAAIKTERHKIRRERDVIEVLDSPEVDNTPVPTVLHRHKHKRHSKENPEPEAASENQHSDKSSKRKTAAGDPELLARKAKLLAAEREKEKRKESAREELEARREKLRVRKEVIDVLSPTAVAASVTAGLNVMVKRKKTSGSDVEYVKRKRVKKHKNVSEDEDDDDMDEDKDDDSYSEEDRHSDAEDGNNEDDSELSSDSAAASEKSYTENKRKKKSKKRVISVDSHDDGDVDDKVLRLPESRLSIREVSKSPKRSNKTKSKRKQKKHAMNRANAEEDDDEDMDVHSRTSHSASEHSGSRSATHSRSHSPTSRSRTRSRSDSRSSRSATSKSRSRSSSRSDRSRIRSRSRDRSEERDMHLHKRKAEAEIKDSEATAKQKPQKEEDESLVYDKKGVPLPNYYPGVQGCRSVEEFQCLNRIEEGTYGVVYRAKDKRTNEIVALKRLKMEKEKEGFPITSLREINTLLKGQHPNIVTVREIVVGSNMDKIFIVMDYVEHDLKSLMETMKNRKQSFFPGEVKCLLQQLLRAVGHLHDNWILHRDLKTSNLLLSHKGVLKVGDFGLAREYGSPLKKYTSLVVTLWYRAPELLLCSSEYSTPIDIWSVGCIFGEFLQMAPLFPGKTEIDELNKIFKDLGTPNEKIWPGYKDLPVVKNVLSQNSQFTEYPVSNLRKRFHEKATDCGISLLQGLLTYDPKQRLTADAALKHAYFKELPLPIDPSMFPTWPAKSELGTRKAMASSPKPPSGGSQFKQLGRDDILAGEAGVGPGKLPISGIITGNKKTAANTGFVLNAGREPHQRQLAMGPGFSLKF